MTFDLTDQIFTDEDKAREHFEAQRWPHGPVCPHCGATSEHVTLMNGKTTRRGLYQCNACREPFTVKMGTVMESSHISYRKWAIGFHIMAASKKGMAAHQLHRMLGVTYKTAWFMAHRIREAMRPIDDTPIGGEGKTVEADETYIGGKEGNKHASKRTVRGGAGGKEAVLSLVERGGKVRSYHLPEVTAATLKPILVAQVNHASFLMTDEARRYIEIGMQFASHEAVAHSMGEYVRGEAHTNTVENYYSILKRGTTGCYFHVSQQHLKRYLTEFDFRYNERIALGVSDQQRAAKAIKGAVGRRLTYRQPRGAQQATA
jgi:transposase-like protein